MRKLIALLMIVFCYASVQATTYYYVGGTGSVTINTSTSAWSTIGVGGAATGIAVSPTTADIFIFDGTDISSSAGLQTGSVTITISASISVGQIKLQNGATVTYNCGSNDRNITFGGVIAGNDFVIPSGCSLSTTGSRTAFVVGTGTTADISGTLNLGAGSNSSLNPADAGSAVFKNGSVCKFNESGTSTIVFNTATAGAVIFNSGSKLIGVNGSNKDIFNGNNVVTFDQGSTYEIQGNSTSVLDLGPGTYANIVYNYTGGSYTSRPGSGVSSGSWTFDDITVAVGSSTFTFDPRFTFIVKGNISNNSTTNLFTIAPGTNLTAVFNMNGTSLQTITNAGGGITVGGTGATRFVNININNVAGVALAGNISLAQAATVTVNNGGIFDVGTYIVSGASTGAFVMGSGGTLKTANTGGLNTSITAPTKAFNSGANYEFNGTATQSTGFSSLTMNTPAALVINNNAGVNLDATQAISGTLTMTAGKLSLGSNSLTVGSATGSSSNYVDASGAGRLKQTVAASPVLFPVGSASAYNPITLTNAGTSDIYGVSVTNGTPANFVDANYQVQHTWTIAETVDGGSNLTMQAQWAASQEGSSFDRNTNLKVGRYQSGTSWEKYTGTLAGSNPYTATASGFATVGTTGVAFSVGNFFVITSDVALSSPSQVGTGNIGQGTTNNVLFNFQLAASTADAGLTSVSFTTAGSYTAADIVNYKLWYNSTNTFSGAVQVGSSITTSLGAGAHTFTGLSQAVANGATGYFFITADISFTAAASNINVAAIATTDLTFDAANVTGSTTASDLQTIVVTTVTLASANPAVSASSISRTVNKNILYKFTLTPATAGALLNQVDFTTAGTYVAADVSKFQLWYKASDDFSTAVQIGSDITTSLGTGAHSFTGLSQSINVGVTGYLWITTDVPVSATLGNTINVDALTTADVTLASGSKTGTAFAGGTQTITPASDPTKFFQTKASGNWNDIATWESSDDNATWYNATVSPTNAATAITVLANHTVTVTAGVTVDDVTVAANGQVTVNSGVTLVINNGTAGVDMNVLGKLVNIGTITTTGALTIGATGEYEHAQNGGTIPTATWAAGSKANITGLTTLSPGGRGQIFSNLIFDCSGLTTQIVWGSGLGTGPTGSNTFQVTGTMTVKRTGSSTLQLHSSGGQERMTVGNYVQNGGSVYLINGYNGTSGGADRIFTVNGSFSIDNSVAANPLFSISEGTAASVKPFTLNVGGDVTIGPGAIVQADITDIPSSSLVLNGTGTQVVTCNGILGDEIININKATGVVNLGSNISITNALTMTAGQLSLGNNNITLVSTASRTAAVSATAVATPFTYGTGKFIVQRYVPGGKRAFRFLGHPFNGTLDLSALTDNILVTGGTGTGGFTPSGTNNPSAFWYDPTIGDESPTNDIGWTAFTTTDGSGAGNGWDQYKGIRVLVRGSIADGLSPATPSAVTMDASGQLNVGTQVVPVAKGTNSGFNFIANPFASNINLTTAGGNITLGTNVVTNHYVWDMTMGSKGGWVNTAFSSSYVLPSFAGFIVKTAATDNITITENAKTTTATSGTLFRNENVAPQMVRLWVKGNNITWDKFELYYNDESKLAEDRHDGVKFINSEVNFFSIANNKHYSIDSRPFVKDDIIPMGFTSAAQQTYTIKATDYSLPANVELYLKDKFLGTETKLEEGTEYTFNITSNTASQGNERFELVQKKAPGLLPLVNMFTIRVSPNPATDNVQVNFSNEEQLSTTITIANVAGQVVRTINAGNLMSGQVNVDVRKLAKGTYYITVNNGKASRTEKMLVQ